MKKPFILFGACMLSLGAARAQTAQKPENGPQIQFDEELYTFDTLDNGARCEHDFVFTNTGNGPLIISNSQTSCGCDVTTWPREPIAPGKSAKITYKYDSKRTGPIYKTFTVTGNFPEGTKIMKVKGYVRPPKAESSVN